MIKCKCGVQLFNVDVMRVVCNDDGEIMDTTRYDIDVLKEDEDYTTTYRCPSCYKVKEVKGTKDRIEMGYDEEYCN